MILKNRSKIVIVEGTSCVGKTTLCESLEKQGWIVLPEAIRYLEKETKKKGDEASPIPGTQEEEEYYQDQLFRVEKQKITEANELRRKGRNVIIDKSAIATVATAKAFEEQKGFNGTFRRAYIKYCQMVQELSNKGMIECDVFLLLTADFNTICERNKMRNHVLEGIWLEEKTIESQRQILEIMTNYVVGSARESTIKKKILDTSNLTRRQVLDEFNVLINNLEKDELEIG